MAFTRAGRFDAPLLRIPTDGGTRIQAVTSADVYVYDSDGSTLSTLWTDEDKGTEADNPVSPDSQGNLEFFAEPGIHVLKIHVDGVLKRTDTVSVPYDPDEIDDEKIPAGGTAKQILSRDAGGGGSAEWQDPDTIDVLDKASAQTVSGVKTFSASPVVPTPSADTEAASKGYTDGQTEGHDHTGATEGVVLDHGTALSGLGDDDHTQYSKADGSRAFTGEVAGVTPTVDASLATKGYVDSAAFMAQDGTALTNDSAAVTATWEDWGTETLTIPDPGVPVSVSARVSGYLKNSTNADQGAVRVSVSLDGGSTFIAGNAPVAQPDTTGATQELPIAADVVVSGTPTGDIVVKAQLRQDTTFGSSLVFENGYIAATVLSS